MLSFSPADSCAWSWIWCISPQCVRRHAGIADIMSWIDALPDDFQVPPADGLPLDQSDGQRVLQRDVSSVYLMDINTCLHKPPMYSHRTYAHHRPASLIHTGRISVGCGRKTASLSRSLNNGHHSTSPAPFRWRERSGKLWLCHLSWTFPDTDWRNPPLHKKSLFNYSWSEQMRKLHKQ